MLRNPANMSQTFKSAFSQGCDTNDKGAHPAFSKTSKSENTRMGNYRVSDVAQNFSITIIEFF